MKHVPGSRRVIGLAALLIIALIVGCKLPLFGSDAARYSSSGAASQAAFQGGYAAMAEVPVSGGELRLVAPQVVELAISDDAVDAAAQRAPGDDGPPQRQELIGFPLRHTAVTAKVAGMVGMFTVEQEFGNPFTAPIEAVYVFPLGDDAAISGYQITIGDRTIAGEIQPRGEARRSYEQARSAGHTAALVEQEKPNIFTQHVANIAPGETVRVKLTYSELLDYQDGTYELAVPLVVGPRYLPADRPGRAPVSARAAGAPTSPGVTSIPYAAATRDASTVSFTAEIDAGVPIGELRSPSHGLHIERVSETRRRVTLARQDELPNRDLVVHYATAQRATMAGVIGHRVGGDGYFLLTVQPKASYRTADVAAREVIVVVDTSGSMDGAPLTQAAAVASGIVRSFGDRDTFNVLQFAGGVAAMAAQPIRGDAQGQERGLRYLAGLRAGGSTEMELGVAAMLAREPEPERVRIIYFLTDGFIGNDDVVLSAARRLAGRNRIMTVGIGAAPNRHLLDRLAVAGRGFATYVALNESVVELTQQLVLRSAYPYLTDVTIDWGELSVRDLSPEPIPDVYAGQPLVISGRYDRPGSGAVLVKARSAGREVTIPLEVTLPAEQDHEAVAQLWARRQVEALTREVDPEVGMSEQARRALTELGLAHHLVTAETSFVAIDRSRVVDGSGAARVVEQPALLPECMVGDDVLPRSSGSQYAQPSATPSSSYSSGGAADYDDNDSGSSWGSGASPPLPTLWLVAAGAALVLAARRRRR
jgi:Ca-activated chloride channel homolog